MKQEKQMNLLNCNVKDGRGRDTKKRLDESFLLPVDEVEYHSSDFLSSHKLTTFMRNPREYKERFIDKTAPIKESAAFETGKAMHCYILEGDNVFNERYVVSDGPINEKTGNPYGKETKSYAAWAAEQTKPVVLTKDYETYQTMRDWAMDNYAVAELLEEGTAEGVAYVTLCGFDCQIRVDWFNPCKGLVDYKTTSDITKFSKFHVKDYMYAEQMAFYRCAIREITGETVPVYLIAQNKDYPYTSVVYELPEKDLNGVELNLLNAMKRLDKCLKKGKFGTTYEGYHILELY